MDRFVYDKEHQNKYAEKNFMSRKLKRMHSIEFTVYHCSTLLSAIQVNYGISSIIAYKVMEPYLFDVSSIVAAINISSIKIFWRILFAATRFGCKSPRIGSFLMFLLSQSSYEWQLLNASNNIQIEAIDA